MPPSSALVRRRHPALLHLHGLLLCCGRAAWVQNPVARHVACPVGTNAPSVCRLAGHADGDAFMNYSVTTLPQVGLLYEMSVDSYIHGTEPKPAAYPIAPQQLPLLVTDPKHRLIYVPPYDAWEPDTHWASFTYVVSIETFDFRIVFSEEGLVVLATSSGGIASSTFDESEDTGGWSVSGNLRDPEIVAGGLKQQSLYWGGLHHYIYGVDEALNLDFTSGMDKTKWYFEASPSVFCRPQLAAAYGGHIRFRIRSMYGNFSDLNSPLDWVTLECASCDSGRGIRLVRFMERLFDWDGSERRVELRLSTKELWKRDPWNSAMPFHYAGECEIAAVLTNLSRVAILGDFTRGGEGVAIDDVEMLADVSEQPAYPLACQKGCFCKYDVGNVHPTCC